VFSCCCAGVVIGNLKNASEVSRLEGLRGGERGLEEFTSSSKCHSLSKDALASRLIVLGTQRVCSSPGLVTILDQK